MEILESSCFPMLSNKSITNEKTILAKNEKNVSYDNEIAEVLNNFLPNITKQWEFHKIFTLLFIGDTDDSTLRGILSTIDILVY